MITLVVKLRRNYSKERVEDRRPVRRLLGNPRKKEDVQNSRVEVEMKRGVGTGICCEGAADRIC